MDKQQLESKFLQRIILATSELSSQVSTIWWVLSDLVPGFKEKYSGRFPDKPLGEIRDKLSRMQREVQEAYGPPRSGRAAHGNSD